MPSIATLMYHEVSSRPESEIQKIYNTQKGFCVKVNTFNQHMSLIASDKRIKIIMPNQLCSSNEYDYNKFLMITFDDGFVGNIDSALPILEKYNIPATFFLIAGKIGSPPYMQWSDVKRLDSSGMIIGSHGCSHKLIIGRKKVFLHKELVQSKDRIEQKIGKKIDSFSFPHGAYDKASLDFAEKAGYKNIFTSDYGFTIRKRKNLFIIPRLNVPRGIAVDDFENLIFPNKFQFFISSIQYFFKKTIKKTIGLENYLHLYTKIYNLTE